MARLLRERLGNHIYGPGDWIREATLQAEFGFSNGPIREALQLLVSEGVLERIPFCGVRVLTLNDRELVELFELRSGMLELAAELAARRRDSTALGTVAELLKLLDRHLTNTPRRLDGRLTSWIIEAAGNARLAEAWGRLVAQSRLYVNEAAYRAKNMREVVTLAKSIVNAIVAGDAAKARKAARTLTQRQLRELNLKMHMGDLGRAADRRAPGSSDGAQRRKYARKTF